MIDHIARCAQWTGEVNLLRLFGDDDDGDVREGGERPGWWSEALKFC